MYREREGERASRFQAEHLYKESAKLLARLADRASGRQNDKKVIRTTCHFPLKWTWEPKWKHPEAVLGLEGTMLRPWQGSRARARDCIFTPLVLLSPALGPFL